MKKLLNTLYVTRQETYVHKERETIVIKSAGEKLAQFPALTISNILCFGQVSVSPPMMGYCGENGIGLVFYTEYGRFLARVMGKQTGNVLLRRTQYRLADIPERANAIARVMVGAKIANARTVLMREIRNHGEHADLSRAIEQLGYSLKGCQFSQSVPQTMGIEGDAAATYFSVFNELIRGSKFQWVLGS